MLHVDLSASIDLQGYLSIQGGLIVGIDRTLDLDKRGSLSVNTSAQGQLSLSYKSSVPPFVPPVPVLGLSGGSTIRKFPRWTSEYPFR